jgi:hypothetical protein
MAARRYDFYLRVVKTILYSRKQKIVKFHAQKQIGKSHVIDIFTSEDMENISVHFSVSRFLLYNNIHICHLAMLSACGYVGTHCIACTEQEPS